MMSTGLLVYFQPLKFVRDLVIRAAYFSSIAKKRRVEQEVIG